LTLAGADGFLINTNELEYGGRPGELKECSKAIRKCKPSLTPAIIHKDLIIHPVQIAQALEDGASGVLLIVAVVGGDLETLLDACTIMGTEALVEVHTINELEFALNKGATTFLVNMWDRTTGKLFSEQARGVASMLPINSLAIAAGNINDMEQVAELGFYGYDGVVLGRGILDVPDVKGFIEEVHSFRGVPRDRGMGMGMKGLPF
jgi:indole-3-glycerol phosphate synthase